MRTLISNIRSLCGIEHPGENIVRKCGTDMALLPQIENAWLLIDGDQIHSFGAMANLPETQADTAIDATGKLVLPAFVDSHTHLVFAAPRETEFVDRIKGLSYAEIAARGGGILNSAQKLRDADEGKLYDDAMVRLQNVIAQGTGAIEIKSGYGLTVEAELKMLRVIRKIKETASIPVKASFLAAHAYPPPFREDHEGYLRLIIQDMLPRVAGEGLADYIDVFCEQGFFSVEDTSRLLEAGSKYGLKAKIHANQLHHSGGVEVGVQHGAISVDHLECVGDAEIAALLHSDTIPTLLPGAAFFLGMHYQPARKMIDAGLGVCIASDYNPGSCPSGNIPLMLTLACTQMKLTPEEAINSVTINGAAALELAGHYGTIKAGKKANLILTKPMSGAAYIPYDWGNNPVERMIINGRG